MAATPESTSPRAAALEALNEAANAHHAIKATTHALSDAVHAFGDNAISIGMYEALWLSIAALDSAIGTAVDKLSLLETTDPAH